MLWYTEKEKNMTDYANSDPLFYNSALLFSNESMEKIKNAKVAVAGVGGVGSIAVEMLARVGVGTLKLADPDVYSEVNLNRQLFATLDTIGQNKAMAAKERILKINPNCKVEVYKEGVNVKNAKEFCKDIDIIITIPDREAIKVLLHKIAKENKIPCVMGSRDSMEGASRWSVRAKLWDYKNKDIETFGATNHKEIDKYSLDELTQDILDEYDEKIKIKKMTFFKETALSKADLFKSISKADLIERIENNVNYFNRHVCSVIANTAGCLAATSTLRYILGDSEDYIGVNLW